MTLADAIRSKKANILTEYLSSASKDEWSKVFMPDTNGAYLLPRDLGEKHEVVIFPEAHEILGDFCLRHGNVVAAYEYYFFAFDFNHTSLQQSVSVGEKILKLPADAFPSPFHISLQQYLFQAELIHFQAIRNEADKGYINKIKEAANRNYLNSVQRLAYHGLRQEHGITIEEVIHYWKKSNYLMKRRALERLDADMTIYSIRRQFRNEHNRIHLHYDRDVMYNNYISLNLRLQVIELFAQSDDNSDQQMARHLYDDLHYSTIKQLTGTLVGCFGRNVDLTFLAADSKDPTRLFIDKPAMPTSSKSNITTLFSRRKQPSKSSADTQPVVFASKKTI